MMINRVSGMNRDNKKYSHNITFGATLSEGLQVLRKANAALFKPAEEAIALLERHADDCIIESKIHTGGFDTSEGVDIWTQLFVVKDKVRIAEFEATDVQYDRDITRPIQEIVKGLKRLATPNKNDGNRIPLDTYLDRYNNPKKWQAYLEIKERGEKAESKLKVEREFGEPSSQKSIKASSEWRDCWI